MKKLAAITVLVFLAQFYWQDLELSSQFRLAPAGSESALAQAFERQQSDLQVRGEGKVLKILADDNNGSRHQRFILELESGQTLLVAHNIDLAPRIDALQPGDSVEFSGEYEWNANGGVVHWTHHDPRGVHPEGWLKHAGRTYR